MNTAWKPEVPHKEKLRVKRKGQRWNELACMPLQWHILTLLLLLTTSIVIGSIGYRLVLTPTVPAVATAIDDGCTLAYVVQTTATSSPHTSTILYARDACRLLKHPVRAGDQVVVYHSRWSPTVWNTSPPAEGSGGFLEGVALLATSITMTVLVTFYTIFDVASAIFRQSARDSGRIQQQHHQPSIQQHQTQHQHQHQQTPPYVVGVVVEDLRRCSSLAIARRCPQDDEDVIFVLVHNPE